jgi:hypothetical protein
MQCTGDTLGLRRNPIPLFFGRGIALLAAVVFYTTLVVSPVVATEFYTTPFRRSLKYHGYDATFFMQLCTGLWYFKLHRAFTA